MFEPYSTMYGSLINLKKLKDGLVRYLSVADLNTLEYEYPLSGDIAMVFITGRNDEELELPAWEHPLLINTVSGKSVVAVDVRRYIRKYDESVYKLSDMFKDRAALDFLVLRATLVIDFMSGDQAKHRTVFKPCSTAMGVWLSNMISTIVPLTPAEMFNTEIITAAYANTLYYPVAEISDNMDIITARVLSSKHSYKLSNKLVRERLESFYVEDSGRLDTLIINIYTGIDPAKHQYVTIDSLVGVMGNVWYGPGGSEVPVMALENMASWMALVYAATSARSYDRTRIGMLLNKQKRIIDSAVIDKHFSNYLDSLRVD